MDGVDATDVIGFLWREVNGVAITVSAKKAGDNDLVRRRSYYTLHPVPTRTTSCVKKAPIECKPDANDNVVDATHEDMCRRYHGRLW